VTEVARLKAELERIRAMRARGVASVSYAGIGEVRYRPDDALRTVEADLERRIAAAENRGRRRVSYIELGGADD
jgi:hypothetical protein